MAYTRKNFKTKKELKFAVGLEELVEVYQPGPFGNNEATIREGKVTLEGPHYPAPHRWYAEAWIKDGRVIKVR